MVPPTPTPIPNSEQFGREKEVAKPSDVLNIAQMDALNKVVAVVALNGNRKVIVDRRHPWEAPGR